VTLRVVDSHCHLDYEGLAERLPDVLQHAETAGVGLMVSIGTRVRKFPGLLQIAEENTNVFCTVGTHPHHAHEELDVTVQDLFDLAQHPRVVGIGEAGLDYHYDFSPRGAQETGFRNHIAAARKADLPLVIHAREADEDVARIMGQDAPCKYLLHCFTGSAELAKRGLDLGSYISFSGILTYKSAENLRVVAREVPLERLLVETDAPYLAPIPHRGKSNEPAFVIETLKQLAAVKGKTAEEMANITSDNFFRLFSKVPRPKNWTS
jgi:TatD DNase family protein